MSFEGSYGTVTLNVLWKQARYTSNVCFQGTQYIYRYSPIHFERGNIRAQNVWDCNSKCTTEAGFWGVSEDFSAGYVTKDCDWAFTGNICHILNCSTFIVTQYNYSYVLHTYILTIFIFLPLNQHKTKNIFTRGSICWGT